MTFACPNCATTLTATDEQAGQIVRCPKCMSTLRVPLPQDAADAGTPAPIPTAIAAAPSAPPLTAALPPSNAPRPSGRKYGFNCGYCSSRLEAAESQGGTEGNCPTCGSQITIPILDRMGRLIDPRTNQIIRPDPHPVHAYAAAGDKAPRILRRHDGSQEIVCPRCQTASPMSVNKCRACGNPFTMEGTTPDLTMEGGGYGTASLVLGIISIPAFCLYVPGPLAVALGGISLYQKRNDTGGKGTSYWGIALGVVGTALSVFKAL